MLNNPFNCLKCGECCFGKGGIWLKDSEISKCAQLLNIKDDNFKRDFLIKEAPLWAVKTAPNGFCILFDTDKKICLIHAFKPQMCRDWPFFKSLIDDQDVFIEAKKHCLGINKKVSWELFKKWTKVKATKSYRSYLKWQNQ